MYLLAVRYILTINENSGVVKIGVPNQDNMRYVSPVWRYVSHHFALIQAVQIGTTCDTYRLVGDTYRTTLH